MTHDNVSNFVIDAQDTIWINHRGTMEKYTVNQVDSAAPQIVQHPSFRHPHPIKYVFYNNKKVIIVDSEGNIYAITPQGTRFIKNLKTLINESGEKQENTFPLS